MSIAACHLMLALAQGDLKDASAWAKQISLPMDNSNTYHFLKLKLVDCYTCFDR
jgi:hypothetical protein